LFVQTLQQDQSLSVICIDELHVNLGPTDRISIPNSHILQSTKFNSALKFSASVQKMHTGSCFHIWYIFSFGICCYLQVATLDSNLHPTPVPHSLHSTPVP